MKQEIQSLKQEQQKEKRPEKAIVTWVDKEGNIFHQIGKELSQVEILGMVKYLDKVTNIHIEASPEILSSLKRELYLFREATQKNGTELLQSAKATLEGLLALTKTIAKVSLV